MVAEMEKLFDIDVIDDLRRLYEHMLSNPQIAPSTWAWFAENKRSSW